MFEKFEGCEVFFSFGDAAFGWFEGCEIFERSRRYAFGVCRDADNEVRRYLRSVSRLKGLILNLITPFKPFKRENDYFFESGGFG